MRNAYLLITFNIFNYAIVEICASEVSASPHATSESRAAPIVPLWNHI